MRPAPPMITTSTNRIDWKKGKVLGVTKVVAAAKNEPAIAGEHRGDDEGDGAHDERIDAHRAGRDLASRAPRASPVPSALRARRR